MGLRCLFPLFVWYFRIQLPSRSSGSMLQSGALSSLVTESGTSFLCPVSSGPGSPVRKWQQESPSRTVDRDLGLQATHGGQRSPWKRADWNFLSSKKKELGQKKTVVPGKQLQGLFN